MPFSAGGRPRWPDGDGIDGQCARRRPENKINAESLPVRLPQIGR